MKQGLTYLSAIVIIFSALGCQEKSPYDNSTPEKMMASLALISEQPKEVNPIPYFYKKDDAKAITEFDEAGGRAIATFQVFKEALFAGFPTKIKSMKENKIELHAQDKSFFSQSFSLSASLIRNQLQEQKPNAYEFVSASEPNENDIITVEYKMLGKKATLDVIEEKGQYVMHMKSEDIAKIEQMTTFFNKADSLFTAFNTDINNQNLNDKNFGEKTEEWGSLYMDLFKLLR